MSEETNRVGMAISFNCGRPYGSRFCDRPDKCSSMFNRPAREPPAARAGAPAILGISAYGRSSYRGCRKMEPEDSQAARSASRHHAAFTPPQRRQSCRRLWLQLADHRLLDHKTHSITVHSADALLLAAADAVADATMKLMAEKSDLASDQAQPQLRHQQRD